MLHCILLRGSQVNVDLGEVTAGISALIASFKLSRAVHYEHTTHLLQWVYGQSMKGSGLAVMKTLRGTGQIHTDLLL